MSLSAGHVLRSHGTLPAQTVYLRLSHPLVGTHAQPHALVGTRHTYTLLWRHSLTLHTRPATLAVRSHTHDAVTRLFTLQLSEKWDTCSPLGVRPDCETVVADEASRFISPSARSCRHRGTCHLLVLSHSGLALLITAAQPGLSRLRHVHTRQSYILSRTLVMSHRQPSW